MQVGDVHARVGRQAARYLSLLPRGVPACRLSPRTPTSLDRIDDLLGAVDLSMEIQARGAGESSTWAQYRQSQAEVSASAGWRHSPTGFVPVGLLRQDGWRADDRDAHLGRNPARPPLLDNHPGMPLQGYGHRLASSRGRNHGRPADPIHQDTGGSTHWHGILEKSVRSKVQTGSLLRCANRARFASAKSTPVLAASARAPMAKSGSSTETPLAAISGTRTPAIRDMEC